MMAMAISSTSFANTYQCFVDQEFKNVELTSNEVVLLGTLEDGSQVRISEDLEANLISMSVKQGDVVTVVQAAPGPISFHQNNGKKASSVHCLPKQ